MHRSINLVLQTNVHRLISRLKMFDVFGRDGGKGSKMDLVTENSTPTLSPTHLDKFIHYFLQTWLIRVLSFIVTNCEVKGAVPLCNIIVWEPRFGEFIWG